MPFLQNEDAAAIIEATAYNVIFVAVSSIIKTIIGETGVISAIASWFGG